MEGALWGPPASPWVSSIPEGSQVICSSGSWPLADDTSPLIEATADMSRPRWSVLGFISQVGGGQPRGQTPRCPVGDLHLPHRGALLSWVDEDNNKILKI